jgi:hypothetical protein
MAVTKSRPRPEEGTNSMGRKTVIYRQGDVALIKVAELPAAPLPVARDNGRLVLAYGEVTGHAHVVDAPAEEAVLLTAQEERRFLALVAPAPLVHEEHGRIDVPAGIYEVRIQEEWTDEMEPARVVD